MDLILNRRTTFIIACLSIALLHVSSPEDSWGRGPEAGPSGKSEIKLSDQWLAKDKVDHFLLSMFATGFTFAVLHETFDRPENGSIYLSGGIAFSMGLGKELRDTRSKTGHASFKDLVADALGVAAAFLVIKVF